MALLRASPEDGGGGSPETSQVRPMSRQTREEVQEVLLLLLKKRVAELLYQTLGISTFQLQFMEIRESWAFGGLD